jgi:hypothetical protein
VRFPFAPERYLEHLRDRTAWAPDYPIEELDGDLVPRPALYRMAHLWTLALLDDRFDTLLLPVLITTSVDAVVDHASDWGLPADFFRHRLASGACLLFIDGPGGEAARWPLNRAFIAG